MSNYMESYELIEQMAAENPELMEKVANAVLREYMSNLTGRKANKIRSQLSETQGELSKYLVETPLFFDKIPNQEKVDAINWEIDYLTKRLASAEAANQKALKNTGYAIGAAAGIPIAFKVNDAINDAQAKHKAKKEQEAQKVAFTEEELSELEKHAAIGAVLAPILKTVGAKAAQMGAKGMAAKTVAQKTFAEKGLKGLGEGLASKGVGAMDKARSFGDDLLGIQRGKVKARVNAGEAALKNSGQNVVDWGTGGVMKKTDVADRLGHQKEWLNTLNTRTRNARIGTGITAGGFAAGNMIDNKVRNDFDKQTQFPDTYNY